VVASCQAVKNVELNNRLHQQRIEYPVIVVPDATMGVYSPTEDDRLIAMFTDFVTQSLNTYTAENLPTLIGNLKPYMDATLLTDSEVKFQRLIRDATADRRASIFVPDSRNQKLPTVTSYQVVRREQNGQQFRDVTLTGQMLSIVGGTVAESIPVEIKITIRKVFASPSNPYGFMLMTYNTRPLVDPSQKPILPNS
jgi:hypothetical protein